MFNDDEINIDRGFTGKGKGWSEWGIWGQHTQRSRAPRILRGPLTRQTIVLVAMMMHRCPSSMCYSCKRLKQKRAEKGR